MKKLILIMMLVFGCVIGTYAQKTVFKFRDAQARAGDAVTEVCVKPTVVEVKILEEKGRIKDVWIRIQKLSGADDRTKIAPVIKNKN